MAFDATAIATGSPAAPLPATCNARASAAALPVGAFTGLPQAGALADVPLVLVMLVACAEHAALEVNKWLFSLHRVRAASWLLFARTSAWAGVAVAALAARAIVSIDGVSAIWLAGDALVVAPGCLLIAGTARRLPAMPALSATRLPLATARAARVGDPDRCGRARDRHGPSVAVPARA
ncbi:MULTISPECIES: hypothetical protein [Burkholderia cepacia complex]|nr:MULTISPECIES: hypothetical protein [Burkholderia cepacia complex]MDN7643712.1 hypothetical protein [Burkholderia cenocepacia]